VAGFAVDDEGHAVGLRCIPAAIFDETGDVVAAVSAAGPLGDRPEIWGIVKIGIGPVG
jgi:IclR family acetate operon transcriptional repressor